VYLLREKWNSTHKVKTASSHMGLQVENRGTVWCGPILQLGSPFSSSHGESTSPTMQKGSDESVSSLAGNPLAEMMFTSSILPLSPFSSRWPSPLESMLKFEANFSSADDKYLVKKKNQTRNKIKQNKTKQNKTKQNKKQSTLRKIQSWCINHCFLGNLVNVRLAFCWGSWFWFYDQ